MNDPFDGELSRRLRNYLEEPRMELWQRILTTTQTNRRPHSTSRNARGFLLLLIGALTVGGLYFFEQTGMKAPTSALLIPSAIPNDRGNEGAVSEVIVNDARSQSEVNIPATIQANEQFILGSNAVVAKSANTSTNNIVVDKMPDKANADMTTVDDDASSAPENLPLTEAAPPEDVLSGSQYVVTGSQHEVTSMGQSGKMEESSKKATKRADEGKTVIHEKKSRDKFNIYFTVMPTFGYQRINSNSSDNLIIESIHRISTFSTDRLGIRAELGVEAPVTDRIKVFGGLVYYQRKQTIDYTEKQVESTEVSEGPNGEIIIIPKYAYVEKSFEYELKNLGVQLGLSYALSKRKFLQTIGTGFEFHVALNKLADNPQAPEFTNNPSAYVFYNLYYRLQYPAESRLKAVFQPTLNYSFYINQNVNAPFYVKPYGLGLNLGFTYNF